MNAKFINISDSLKETLISALKNIEVPELNSDAWCLGILKEVAMAERVTVDLVLPSFGLRSEKYIALNVKKALLSEISDPSIIDINFYSDVKPAAVQSIKTKDISDVRNIILVASGKGGVGKSTVAANLAIAMASLGCRVGLLDADVYGPSVPIMFDLQKEGIVKGFTKEDTKITYMVPPIKHGVSLMSIGFLVDTDAPMIWRGPMIASASMQMFNNVYWGQLDYLIIDMPPGTGDIQLTIAQKINVAGAIIVSTPQDVALKDVIRAKKMFDKVNIKNIGLIENMSYFVCDGCQKRHEIFSHGGAKETAKSLGLKVLGEIPLVPEIRVASDRGLSLFEEPSENIIKEKFTEVAFDVVAEIVKTAGNQEPNNNVLLNQVTPKQAPNSKKRRLNTL